MATNGTFAQQDQFKAVPENYTAGAPADAGADNNNLSKDEVGWYFVEQYYTTLSKSPEKLHVSPHLGNLGTGTPAPGSNATHHSFSTASALSLSPATKPKSPMSLLDAR